MKPDLSDQEREELRDRELKLLADFRSFLAHPFLTVLTEAAEENEHAASARLATPLSPEDTARCRERIEMLRDIADGRLFEHAYTRQRDRLRRLAAYRAQQRARETEALGGSRHPGRPDRKRPLA